MKSNKSFILAAAFMFLLAGCGAADENKETVMENSDAVTSEAVSETTAETTEISVYETTVITTSETTSETTAETSAVTTTVEETKPAETAAEVKPSEEASPSPENNSNTSSGDSDNDARYKAFFDNSYPDLADKLYLTANKIDVKYAYTDLDGNGNDELLIGDESHGVYAVVTENGGSYNTAEICGWGIQYGARPAAYIGNGCFEADINNGNNYGSEFRVIVLWKYSSAMKNCGVLARFSGTWNFPSGGDSESKVEVFIANDENDLSDSSDRSTMNEVMDKYSFYDTGFGDNYKHENGSLVRNEVIDHYYEKVDANKGGGLSSLDGLDWKSVN